MKPHSRRIQWLAPLPGACASGPRAAQPTERQAKARTALKRIKDIAEENTRVGGLRDSGGSDASKKHIKKHSCSRNTELACKPERHVNQRAQRIRHA